MIHRLSARSRSGVSLLCLWIFAASISIASTPTAIAGELPNATPTDVGMSSQAMEQIKPAMQKLVDSGKIAGIIVGVARKGKQVYLEAIGKRDLEADKSMNTDSIVRIYSMSKPITSVAVMMLVESGKVDLDSPVARYLPGFGDSKVFVRANADSLELADPERSMTVRDLLRHTAGFSYGFFGNTYVDQQYREIGVLSETSPLKELAAKLQKVPLLHQPGSRWHYSVATDVCGYLVEVVSGQPFDEFLQSKIFEPLDMRDTGFIVPDEKIERFSNNYGPNTAGPGLKVIDVAAESRYRKQPSFFSGGGGLVSTARDYLRFCQMLINRGILDGKRVLRTESVAAMTSNQLTGSAFPIQFGFPVPGVGFGLGVSVVVESSSPNNPVGEYGWGGAASTNFWVSPNDELAVVVMTQFMPFSLVPETTIRPLIYDALTRAKAASPAVDSSR